MRRTALLGLVLSFTLGALPALPRPASAKEPEPPTIVFLDAEQAAAAIVDESVEPYFSLLQPIEMVAKTGGEPLEGKDLAAQRDECRARYRRGVRAFPDAEKKALTTFATRLHAAWCDAYPRIAGLPWSFLGVEDSIEGGLPHTRGKSIVIPKSFGTALANAAAGDPRALRQGVELLAHEQSHVLERLDPALFAPLYTSWGFVRMEGLAPAKEILPRHVVNPDGVRVEWVFPIRSGNATAYEHPLVAFRDVPTPSMPRDFEVIAVEMTKEGAGFRPKHDAQGALVVHPLESIEAYGSRFGGIEENFHPNEIFAVFLSAMVLKDSFGGSGLPRPSEATGKDFATLRSWCRKNLAAKPALQPK